MRRVIIPALLSLAMLLGSVASVWADSASTSQANLVAPETAIRFDRTAELLYRAARESNRQAGYLYVQQLRGMMDKQMKRLPLSEAGWAIVERSAAEIEYKLSNGKPGSDWLSDAARIRLAADAIVRPEAPLWHSYETVMRDDLERVVKAWNRMDGRGAESARAAIDLLAVHYDRIEAAVKLQADPAKADGLKERIAYTTGLLEADKRQEAQPDWTNQALADLETSLSVLFEGTAAAEPLPAVAPIHAGHPVSWILMLGSVIMGVLAYVGYRKYKQQPYGIKPFR